MRIPVVELDECILCGICHELCPEVFSLNPSGYIEVIDLPSYPGLEVDEVIKVCPTGCIHWTGS